MADPNRPTPRDRVDRVLEQARAKAEPQLEKAKPQVEKAAAKAGSLLGQLRERAQQTAKSFGEGYGKTPRSDEPDRSDRSDRPDDDAPRRPKPGPR